MSLKITHIHLFAGSLTTPNRSKVWSFLGLIFCIAFSFNLSAQNQMFLYDELTEARAVIATLDGGFIIGGRIGLPYVGTEDDATLAKVDPDGTIQWQQKYGGAEGEDIIDLAQAANGNYLFTGYTSSYDINGTAADLFAGMVEPNGNVVFLNSLGSTSADRGNGIIGTSDGGVVATGCLDCFGQSDLYLTKMNAAGIVQWAYSNYNLGYTAEGYDVIQTSDGGYAITGRINQGGNNLLYLLKTDANGNELWNQTFGGAEDDEGRTLLEASNGDLLIIGYSRSFSITSEDVYVVRTNSAGVYQWHQSYGAIADGEFGYDIKELPTGDLLMVGSTWSFGAGNGDIYLIKTEADGDTIWTKAYGTAEKEETGRSLSVKPDGTILIAGINRIFTGGGTNLSFSNGLIIQADANGNINDNYIKGNVYHDLSGDCAFQNGEPGLVDWVVQLSGAEDLYTTTDSDGNYEFVVPAGTYELRLISDTYNWDPCLDPFNLTVSGPFDTLNFDLPVLNDISSPYLEVDISAAAVSACSNQIYAVNYCNKGSAMANAAEVRVALDPYFTYVGSSISGSSSDGINYSFLLGNLNSKDCGSFEIEIAVDCNAPLGLTHCMEARILPDDIALPPSPIWDQSSLVIESTCVNDSSVFTIRNVGIAGMTTTQNYIVIEDDLVLFTAPVTLEFGAQEVLKFPANGKTYRVEIDQSPGHPGRSMPSATEEACGTDGGGGFSLGFVTQFPEDDADFFVSIDCQENTNTIVPFEKRGYPKGTGSQHFIDPNEDLEYHIRFRNTLSETVETVVIRDTLSSFLDLSTVRFGASSHPYDYELYGNGIVKFTFHNINLQSIVNNPAESIGFVKFRVSQLPDNPPGTVITNKSATYLDYHPPIHSPEIFRTIRDLIVYAPAASSVCLGDPYNGEVFTENTVLYDTVAFSNYDSITITQLVINPVFQMTFDTSICEGEVLYFANREYTKGGIHIAELQSINGCDSTYTITLEVRESPYEEEYREICTGDSLFFGGNIYTTPGKYVIINTATNGCDSSVHLTLKVNEPVFAYIDTVMQVGDYYEQILIEADTTFEIVYATEMNCDSTVIVTVDVTGVGFYDPIDKALKLNIFPNPTRGDVLLEYTLPQTEDVEIRLYHPLGQQVGVVLPVQRLSAGQHSQRLSLADQPPGTYLLWIRTSRGIQIRKVIKWD